jgi:hypothetical protein
MRNRSPRQGLPRQEEIEHVCSDLVQDANGTGAQVGEDLGVTNKPVIHQLEANAPQITSRLIDVIQIPEQF